MRKPKYQFLQLIIQVKIAGRREPVRRRTSWLKNIRQWFGKTSIEWFRAALIKTRMIANIRSADQTPEEDTNPKIKGCFLFFDFVQIPDELLQILLLCDLPIMRYRCFK